MWIYFFQFETGMFLLRTGKGKKVKFTLEQGMKAQRESRDIPLLFP